MILHRREIERIQDALTKFPDVNTFELKQESESGIGNILSMTFAQEVNGLDGSFSLEITGVEDW